MSASHASPCHSTATWTRWPLARSSVAQRSAVWRLPFRRPAPAGVTMNKRAIEDRKSTRLNSSHTVISYAVFCLKKKKKKNKQKYIKKKQNKDKLTGQRETQRSSRHHVI